MAINLVLLSILYHGLKREEYVRCKIHGSCFFTGAKFQYTVRSFCVRALFPRLFFHAQLLVNDGTNTFLSLHRWRRFVHLRKTTARALGEVRLEANTQAPSHEPEKLAHLFSQEQLVHVCQLLQHHGHIARDPLSVFLFHRCGKRSHSGHRVWSLHILICRRAKGL